MADSQIGVAFITHSSKRHLSRSLPPVVGSRLQPRVIVVNSSSHDGTVEEARRLGAETLVIPRVQFNHGLTRELVRKKLATPIVIMMTPDAYPVGDDLVEKLTEPLRAGRAAASYARQIAHDGAGILEAFPRQFNYPARSELRSLDDIARLGMFTFFSSDACSAYLNEALDEIGGFQAVLTSEDTFAVARLLRRGYRVAYVAEAVVQHSHTYSLWQEFARSFDTGYVRKLHADLLAAPVSDEARGRLFFVALTRELARQRKYGLVPYAVLQTAIKLLGYKVGKAGRRLPVSWRRHLSSQDYYWTSETFAQLGF
jgi:GT2 family glycosyltransferase